MSIEAMKQALDAWENLIPIGKYSSDVQEKAIADLRKAIEQAEKQERNFCSRCGKRLGDGIHTCTPPEVEEQEPVALPEFMRVRLQREIDSALNPKGMSVHDGKAKVLVSDLQRLMRVADTAPPRKEWVSLTEAEIDDIHKKNWNDFKNRLESTGAAAFSPFSVAHAIEAKLKEKNG